MQGINVKHDLFMFPDMVMLESAIHRCDLANVQSLLPLNGYMLLANDLLKPVK